MVDKPRIAVVFHHIGPYHHARLNTAADRLSVTGFEWSAKGYDAWGAAGSRLRGITKFHFSRKQPPTARGTPSLSKRFGRLWNRRDLMWLRLTAGIISDH